MPSNVLDHLNQVRTEIEPGSTWAYFDGGSYRILSIELNATGYEVTHQVGIVVVYEQLRAGHFSKGQIWVRALEDFQGEVVREGVAVRKFTRVDDEAVDL